MREESDFEQIQRKMREMREREEAVLGSPAGIVIALMLEDTITPQEALNRVSQAAMLSVADVEKALSEARVSRCEDCSEWRLREDRHKGRCPTCEQEYLHNTGMGWRG